MKGVLRYIIITYLYSNVCGNNIILPTNDANQDAESLSKCIVEIRDQGIIENPTIHVLKQNFRVKDNSELFLNTMIKTFVHENVPIVISAYAITEKLKISIPKESLIIMITVNKCEVNLIPFPSPDLNINFKYLFIFENKPSEECIFIIANQKIFAQEHDVTFIFKDDVRNQYNFLAFIPERNTTTCNGSTPVQINTCVGGSLNNPTVFPQKSITNLRRCPINLGMQGTPPFFKLENSRSIQEYLNKYGNVAFTTNVTGSDVEIMKIAVERLNGTAVFIEGNFNSSAFIVSRNLRVIGGGLTLFQRMKGPLTYSVPYGSNDVVWVYAVTRETRRWSNFIANISGLYYFIVFYICYSFVWKGITFFDGDAVSIKKTFLYGLGAMVGTASLPPPRSRKQKILTILYLFMCIHFSTYFSIQLYSFLVVQKPPEMFQLHDDILESDRIPYMRPWWQFLLQDEKFQKYVRSGYLCPSMPNCTMEMLAHKGATLIYDEALYNYQVTTAVKDEARLLRIPESVFVRHLYFILVGHRNFGKDYINKIVTTLLEAGISHKLYLDAIGADIVAKANIAAKNVASNDYSCESGCSISLPQIAPVFYLWLVGCAFSSLVFMLEVIWNIQLLRSFFKRDGKIGKLFLRRP